MADVWTKRSDGSTEWATRENNGSSAQPSGFINWTTVTRPVTTVYDGMLGFHTDFNGFEHWDSTLLKWVITSGTWTTATRPATTNIAPGSKGFNSDVGIGNESWDGTNWGKT